VHKLADVLGDAATDVKEGGAGFDAGEDGGVVRGGGEGEF